VLLDEQHDLDFDYEHFDEHFDYYSHNLDFDDDSHYHYLDEHFNLDDDLMHTGWRPLRHRWDSVL